MAPSSWLFPRQSRPGDDFDDLNPEDDDGMSSMTKGALIIGGCFVAFLLISGVFLWIVRRRRARKGGAAQLVPLHNRPVASGSNLVPAPYYSKPQGYESTPDQNQSLLGNAAMPGTAAWEADHTGVGSTQDGFGYTTANITRPASIANFDAPPPRYEEAAAAPSPFLNPGRPPPASAAGAAAAYYDATPSGPPPAQSSTRGLEPERGRSATRETEGRGRALSVDTRSVNGDRRRSVSRFREEGMDAVNLTPAAARP